MGAGSESKSSSGSNAARASSSSSAPLSFSSLRSPVRTYFLTSSVLLKYGFSANVYRGRRSVRGQVCNVGKARTYKLQIECTEIHRVLDELDVFEVAKSVEVLLAGTGGHDGFVSQLRTV
jgi:hypothetical protein